MSQGKKSNSSTKRVNVKTLTCVMCGETKKANEYYQSYNPIHQTGKLPYCKKCLKNMCLDDKGNINIEKLKSMLKLIDRPYLYDIVKISFEDRMDTIGCILKNLAMPQYRNLGWQHSIFEPSCSNSNSSEESNLQYNYSNEVLERWKGYPIEDIEHLENFYNDMQEDNRIESVQDKKYLRKLAIIDLEQEKAAQRQDWATFDKLGSMFSKFMTDSKLRAQDRSDADRNGGIRNFCQIYSEVEKDDFIPPWIHYQKIHGLSQDVLDYTIMYNANFILRLNKHERMTKPPEDTPKARIEELDLEHSKDYHVVNINKEEEDVIESVD